MGHLEMLKWLREIGFLGAKQLVLMQQFHENGCPWDEEVFTYAAFNGCFRTLNYLKEFINELDCRRGQIELVKLASNNTNYLSLYSCK